MCRWYVPYYVLAFTFCTTRKCLEHDWILRGTWARTLTVREWDLCFTCKKICSYAILTNVCSCVRQSGNQSFQKKNMHFRKGPFFYLGQQPRKLEFISFQQIMCDIYRVMCLSVLGSDMSNIHRNSYKWVLQEINPNVSHFNCFKF